MSLSRAQQNDLDRTLEYFLELPDEAKSLQLTADKLTQAFEGKIEDEQDEPYFTIQDCIKNPSLKFQNLEKKGSLKLTNGMVRTAILDSVTRKLETHQEFKTIKWGKDSLQKILEKDKTYQTPFERKVDPDSENPDLFELSLAVPPPIARMFTKTLYVDEAYLLFRANVITKTPRQEITQIINLDEFELGDFQTDDQRNQYLHNVIDSESKAIETASEVILKYLNDEKIVLSKESKGISEGARKIITYDFYFNLIKDRRVPFLQIKKISNKEADALASPVTMEFLSNNKCSIATAKRLSPRVIENHFYYQRIIKKT